MKDQDMSEQLEQMAEESLTQAFEKIAQMGKEAGLSARQGLALMEAVRVGLLLVGIEALLTSNRPEHIENARDKLGQTVDKLAVLAALAIVNDDQLDEGPDRLLKLYEDALVSGMVNIKGMAAAIKEDPELQEQLRTWNEQQAGQQAAENVFVEAIRAREQ